MDEKRIVVRAAEHGDYEAVMRMSRDIYAGRDYLPVLYHILLHDKNSNCFVVLLDGEIVGYQNNYVVDGGTRYIKMGLRVAEQSRGMGLARVLGTETESLTRLRYPDLRLASWSLFNDPPGVALGPAVKVVTKWSACVFDAIPYDFIRDSLRLVPQDVPVQRISQVNLSQSIRILTDSANQRALFPDKYFTAYPSWFPYLLSNRNLRDAALRNDVTVSFGADGDTCESLVFRRLLQVPKGGLRCDLFMYGTSLSPSIILAHVYKAFEYLLEKDKRDSLSSLLLYFPTHVDKEAVFDRFLPGCGYKNGFATDECITLVKEI